MILEVNGVRVPAEAIRAEAARLRHRAIEAGEEITLELANDLVNEAEKLLIERVLIDLEATRLGLVIQPEEVNCHTNLHAPEIRADIQRRLRVDKLVEFWTKDLKPPGAKAIKQIYARQREELRVPEFIFVEQIIKNVYHEDEREGARAQIETVAQELDAGGDFHALVAEHSDCPERGGALGFITRGEMVPEFEEVVFALPLGRPSPVFESRFGWHIARVTQRKPAGVMSFADAAPRIARSVLNQLKEQELAERLEALHARASVRRLSS
jgi:hypothetical protein